MYIVDLKLNEHLAHTLYQIYSQSFPSDELRNEADACKAFLRKEALHLGYLDSSKDFPLDFQQIKSFVSAYLLSDDTLFIEYLITPEMYRGQQFAPKLIQLLQQRFKKILLEIEIPHENHPFTLKRKNFYENLGFTCLSKTYFLPQMDKEKEARPMWLYLFQKEPFSSEEEKADYLEKIRFDLKKKVYFDFFE